MTDSSTSNDTKIQNEDNKKHFFDNSLIVNSFIDTHAEKSDKTLKYKIVSSCMNECVNDFKSDKIVPSERNCLKICFYGVMENYYVNNLK